jgi:hypothetical protein
VNSLAYCVDMTGPVWGGCEEDPIGYSADVTGPNVRLEYTCTQTAERLNYRRGTGSHMAPLRGSALVVHLPSNGGGAKHVDAACENCICRPGADATPAASVAT